MQDTDSVREKLELGRQMQAEHRMPEGLKRPGYGMAETRPANENVKAIQRKPELGSGFVRTGGRKERIHGKR